MPSSHTDAWHAAERMLSGSRELSDRQMESVLTDFGTDVATQQGTSKFCRFACTMTPRCSETPGLQTKSLHS